MTPEGEESLCELVRRYDIAQNKQRIEAYQQGRADALEEAARVAEAEEWGMEARNIAAAIRALKESGDQQ